MPRASGFTLLEILVVMVLIAILTAAAVNTINFAVRSADAETEARRIAALGALAAEEAMLTGREYGLRIDADALHFLLFDDTTGQWQPLTDDNTFHPRDIPDGVTLDLVLEGQGIKLGDDTDDTDSTASAGEDEEDEEDIEPPQLVFLSSGEITPFTLTVEETGGETWTVEGDLLGRMEISSEEP